MPNLNHPLSLRDRRGVGGAASFIIVMPVWYFAIGLLIVFAWWFWSLSANFIAITQAGQEMAVGRNGESRRLEVIAAGLGGFAAEYRQAASYSFLERAVVSSVNRSVPVTGLPAPDATVVRARTVSRLEGFYPRPPWGGWE
ncbi:MAG: hypothetical protein ACUVSX_15075 [Aggregatilineales bacterium]